MNETEFNNKYPVGTPVRYHPVIGQPEYVETETRSEAWTLGNGQVIVKVKGRAGGVSIAAIEAVEQMVAADGYACEHEFDRDEVGLFCIRCGEPG